MRWGFRAGGFRGKEEPADWPQDKPDHDLEFDFTALSTSKFIITLEPGGNTPEVVLMLSGLLCVPRNSFHRMN